MLERQPGCSPCVAAAKAKRALLESLQIDAVHIATELIAREVLARTPTPEFWSFVEHALTRDDQWATDVRDRLIDRCGRRTPERDVITLHRTCPRHCRPLAPRAPRPWAPCCGNPDDRESTPLRLAALVLIRGGQTQFVPEDTALEVGDRVLLVGKPSGLSQVRDIFHYPATVEYLATGRVVPLTWVWAKLTARRRSRDDVSSSCGSDVNSSSNWSQAPHCQFS